MTLFDHSKTIPLLFILLAYPVYSNDLVFEKMVIADFSKENLAEWKTKSFSGETLYSIVKEGDETVLQATSEDAASGLAKEQVIDLFKTPFLNWSWKISQPLNGLDETNKAGDDYAARLYVVKSGGWKIWNTIALNYVWSSNQAKYSQWDNAFAGDNARMFALKGKDDKAHVWVSEKRNVYEDLIQLFGDKGSDKKNEEAYRYLDAVAIMTDTDNSHLKTEAFYSDIYFSNQ